MIHKMTRLTLAFTVCTSALPLSACGPNAAAKATMANPASQNCIAHGGHLTIQQTSQGARGFCSLADGRTLDEWEYFHQTHP